MKILACSSIAVVSVALSGAVFAASEEGVFDAKSYYRLTTKWRGDGKSLDVVNDGKNNNQLILARTGKFSGQFWKITPVGGGYYRLTTEWQGSGKSLDVVNDRKNNNQPILADTGNYFGQFWKISKVK
jgi:ricin-type beta-trefoil lectin protein